LVQNSNDNNMNLLNMMSRVYFPFNMYEKKYCLKGENIPYVPQFLSQRLITIMQG